MKLTEKDAARFWSKVDRSAGSDGCWLWIAATNGVGYGSFRIGSLKDNSRRRVLAHRVSWELAHGEVGLELLVLHRCDIRRCVNPKHLFLGTQADNFHDCMSKNRWVVGDHAGIHNGRAKLTDGDVRAIRTEYGSGGCTQGKLATRYGVTDATISAAILGRTWRHAI